MLKFLGLHELSEDEVAEAASDKMLHHIEELPVHMQSIIVVKTMEKLVGRRTREVELCLTRLEELQRDLTFMENYVEKAQSNVGLGE